MKHTRQDLKIMQGWSLERKIRVTQTRIMEWYMRYDGQVFISFSGGKDSTVLLDLARRVYPDIPAVYVDTGLEYPELRDFVKTKDNVIWLRPRYPFTQILEKYGYPIISKEVSDVINGARKGQPYRLARLNGELLDKNGKKSIYNCENYKYLLDAPFKISARCCYHMKKAPLNKFERQSGRHPITGVLACESKLREQSWIKFGCNGFERQRPLSQPLAFWLEEDILRYLKMTGIPYAPIYGDIVESRKKNGTPILKTTGVSRSGCMYCMYGVHLEHEPNRFQLMQVTHPQQYDYCINKLGCGALPQSTVGGGSLLGSKKKEEAFPVNEALLNVITPMGLEIKRNSLVIGENLGKVYGAVRYPQKVDMGWLSKITNIPSTIVSVGITPIDNGSLISAISKSIVQQRGAADSAKDPLTRQRAEKAAEDGEKIMQRIDQEGETVAMMSLTVMPIAQDEVNFTKVCRRVESAFNIQKCKVRTLANLQKEGFQSISPTYPANSTVDSIVSRIIPMSTFVGGFPFASSGYNDGRGYYFAKDSNGGLVILDTWERGNDRTNSSFVIMGVAGIGKSTVVKHIMLSEYMKGTKILCIDPESEYKDMCRNLNGSWLNAGGGKNGRSNLLQIRPAPRDDDDETDKLYTDEGNGMSDMALHMKTLEIEFSLYLPSLTDMQKAILKQTIIELYNQFGIFWETDIRQLKATDFPILSDLHALLEKKAEANKENPVYRDLAMLLYDAAAGSDSFLWNGHTTLEANSRFICLDTHDLQNASDNVKRTQYLNLLSWCWEEMSRDRNERCLLVCDEAYLMIDPQVPQSLVFLRNVEKRARKYEAGLAIISHSVVDFLAPEVKMYGQALLDIPCYKILMGCDGKNLQETTDLYNLTDAEQELLESKRRGHALFIIGSKRLHVNFEIPAYKFSYMGKAGGR